MKELIDALERLVPTLDLLAQAQAAQLRQSTELLAHFRGAGANGMLAAGTVQIGAGLKWAADYAIPFAAVSIADVNSLGPVVVSTVDSDATSGPGTATLEAGDVATVPLVGRALHISAAKAGALFVAVYVAPQPLSWAKA